MSFNRVQILGNLGHNPEIRYTSSGQAVCNFSVATNESWIDKQGQQQERATWLKIVVWGAQGETCAKYLSKGREVFVEGSLRSHTYEDKENVKRTVMEVIATRVHFIGPNPNDKTADNA